jgi:phenylacetic acid degradation operon negative regulatory protein
MNSLVLLPHEIRRIVKARRAIFEIYVDYVQHYGGSIRVRSLLRLCEELGFTGVAVRAALCRLTQQGWLERGSFQKQSYYSLSATGKERVEETAPRIFGPHTDKWDGQWIILTYSLPEKLRHLREQLRRELIWLGYGPLTPATWIIPKPIAELTLRHLALRRLDKYVNLFRARHINSLATVGLVSQCWDLGGVQKRYREFIKTWEPLWRAYQVSFNTGKPPAENICFVSKMRLFHEYSRFLYVDPGLPIELLPEGWLAAQAWRVFRNTYFLLSERALNFFESNFQGPPQTQAEQQEGRQKVMQGVVELA